MKLSLGRSDNYFNNLAFEGQKMVDPRKKVISEVSLETEFNVDLLHIQNPLKSTLGKLIYALLYECTT